MKYIPIILILLWSCSVNKNMETVPQPVAIGLDGREYFKPDLSGRPNLDSNYHVAFANFEADQSEENYIWLGRREAYRYNYREAIEIFSRGLVRYPESYKLYRHRGHRYITVRDFDHAIADLERAADLLPPDSLEIEPDGQPNKLNIPLSTTHFNVWYHLGLAHYLKGDFASAEKAYDECLKVSGNDDLLCATADWLYMTYRRQGKTAEATAILDRIHDKMNIIENDSYYKRLMMYKGTMRPEDLLEIGPENEDPDLAIATQGYGVGNWYLYNGDTATAVKTFQKVVQGNHFAAFGFIAAEAELVRVR